MKKYKYLETNRLNEVITLIQILALSSENYCTGDHIKAVLNKSSSKNKSWNKIILDHPEFFLIENNKVYLNYRHSIRAKMNIDETMNLVSLLS